MYIYPSTERRRRFFSITAFGAFHIQVTKSTKNKKEKKRKGTNMYSG